MEQPIQPIQILQIILGLSVTLLFGLVVQPLVKHVKNKIEMVPPSESLKNKWLEITGPIEVQGKLESGEIIGLLERLLFFIAIWISSYLIIGGWLAFKVASKWEVWKNIISVPESLDTDVAKVDQLDYLSARRRWASHRYVSFLIGTISNILVAFGGVLVGKYVYPLLF